MLRSALPGLVGSTRDADEANVVDDAWMPRKMER